MLEQIRPPVDDNGHEGMEIIKLHMDEENLVGEPNSFDLAYSCLSLHWINDLPGVCAKVLQLLKNDAPFIGKRTGRITRAYEMLTGNSLRPASVRQMIMKTFGINFPRLVSSDRIAED